MNMIRTMYLVTLGLFCLALAVTIIWLLVQ